MPLAYPDTLVGTDSHTTMINGLGVLGWGVGGIEAEAAMLGQPVSMLIPQVVGFKLHGQLPEGATATDLVLTVTQMLRKQGVVGKFVEFYGDGLAALPLADRATIANMAPEYGATCGIFPVDAETLRYLRFTGRPEAQVKLVEAYCKEQGLFHTAQDAGGGLLRDSPGAGPRHRRAEPGRADPAAGPRPPGRRQDGVRQRSAGTAGQGQAQAAAGRWPSPRRSRKAVPSASRRRPPVRLTDGRQTLKELHHGSVVIAAITSCTNTSNPSVMLAAGLLAKKAVAAGPQDEAMGQDQPGARLEGGHRLPDRSGPDALAGATRLLPGRLRLHHLHRQQRSLAGADFQGDRSEATWWWRRC